jgi:N-acetylneuraminic acid mutarotase
MSNIIPMKNFYYLTILSIVFVVIGCKRSTEPFGFYRPSHPQNFITTRNAELYAYTANDSVVLRADYYMKVLGQIMTYGNEILDFGHVWHPNNTNPRIGIDSLMTNSLTGDNKDDVTFVNPGADSISFTSPVSRLKANTTYYIRSYVITGDGKGTPVDTGYNPVTTVVKTKDAIDEWFEVTTERPTGARFGAVGFSFGDSLFFGTGSFGQGILTNNMWMYNPLNNTWNGDFRALPVAVVGAVGFGVEFKEIGAQQGSDLRRCIYIGLGDLQGDDLGASKTRLIFEYDFMRAEPAWLVRSEAEFIGPARSNAVSFVIGDRVYVGTGKRDNLFSDWYVFMPAFARDGNPETPAWKSLGFNIPGRQFAKPRTGAIAFSMNGRGYFGLGYDSDGNFLNDFWEYRPSKDDPIGGSWTQKRSFPGTPRANAVGFAIGDQGYVGTGDNIVGNMEGSHTGQIFEDFYRYDPFNDRWTKEKEVRHYTSDKKLRIDISKKVTRAVGFSSRKDNIGYVGFGIVPTDLTRAQGDFWFYRPYVAGNK